MVSKHKGRDYGYAFVVALCGFPFLMQHHFHVHLIHQLCNTCERESKIRINALWAISATFWNYPRFSPCETGGRKAREISICCRNFSQGSYSFFTFPLKTTTFLYRHAYFFFVFGLFFFEECKLYVFTFFGQLVNFNF